MKGLRPTAGTVCLGVYLVVELGLLGWWLTTGSTLGFVAVQILLMVIGAVLILVFRYLRFRHRYEEAIATNAMLAERNRLAEEMHDILGHELSVIALRAGGLQVHSTGATQAAAAEIRRDVERAVDRLRQTLSVLRTDSHDARYETVTEPIGAMVDRIRATGTAITLVGLLPEQMAGPVERTLYRVVREALTNAIKHAPDQPITVISEDDLEQITLTVRNPISAAQAKRPHSDDASSGIEALRHRVSLVGGQLAAHSDGASFSVTARLPQRGQVSHSLFALGGPRRPLRATLLSAVVPSLLAVAVIVGFYTWSVHDGTIDNQTFDRITTGMPAPVAKGLLPARQAPVQFLPSAPHDPAWGCAYYSDGNFPLGLAVFEVCYHDGAVVDTIDLRQEPWL